MGSRRMHCTVHIQRARVGAAGGWLGRVRRVGQVMGQEVGHTSRPQRARLWIGVATRPPTDTLTSTERHATVPTSCSHVHLSLCDAFTHVRSHMTSHLWHRSHSNQSLSADHLGTTWVLRFLRFLRFGWGTATLACRLHIFAGASARVMWALGQSLLRLSCAQLRGVVVVVSHDRSRLMYVSRLRLRLRLRLHVSRVSRLSRLGLVLCGCSCGLSCRGRDGFRCSLVGGLYRRLNRGLGSRLGSVRWSGLWRGCRFGRVIGSGGRVLTIGAVGLGTFLGPPNRPVLPVS